MGDLVGENGPIMCSICWHVEMGQQWRWTTWK